MKYSGLLIAIVVVQLISSCKKENFTAQQIVDQSIEVSGSNLWKSKESSFDFRDYHYESTFSDGRKVLKRSIKNDTATIADIKLGNTLERFINDSLIKLPDTLAVTYSNSVNSVHYFARLPFGLNDPAVNKELIGEVVVMDKPYYKVKVTFNQKDGGEDYDDVYIYWFNKETFKPDYLAYEFHVDGGGMRFREAYNERYVGGIRFVDYKNYKPKKEFSIINLDKAFESNGLELLSNIELKKIEVN